MANEIQLTLQPWTDEFYFLRVYKPMMTPYYKHYYTIHSIV